MTVIHLTADNASAVQPLRVSGVNGRYLIDAQDRPVFLAGMHTWGNVQDGDVSDPPAVFDWAAYLEALLSYGHNFTKLWTHETGRGWSDITDTWWKPCRYDRTGPGNDNDGKLKFDLTSIEQDWLDRLYNRAMECQNNGIYVCVQLFQGWQIESKGLGGAPATYHPYLAANNINSVDGDQNDDGELTETHVTGVTNVVLEYQLALVRAVIDRLNGLDNVIWEITNEDTGSAGNTAWQEYLISYIKTYEAGKPKQHLVGFTVQYPSGNNDTLDASNADWVSYNDRVHPRDGTKANLADSDHYSEGGGLTDQYNWMWIDLCIGSGGLFFMDEWDGAAYGEDRRNSANHILVRKNLGYVLDLIELLNDLLGMTPQAALCSTGYCLAKDHATAAEYVCFQDGTGAFTLDLTNASGTLNLRWLRCADGTIDTGTVSGGAERTLTPPWAGKVVAYVYH